MGFFGNKEHKIIKDLCSKSEAISKDITREIDELFVELKSEYEQSQEVVNEFSTFVNELKNKLNADDAKKLLEFSSKLNSVKRCARKGVEAMRELSRDQKKATRETIREYQEYLYV
jgi:ribosome biogenesis protein Nip4